MFCNSIHTEYNYQATIRTFQKRSLFIISAFSNIWRLTPNNYCWVGYVKSYDNTINVKEKCFSAGLHGRAYKVFRRNGEPCKPKCY